MIWTMVAVPQNWFTSVIICLQKEGINIFVKNISKWISFLGFLLIIEWLRETYESLITNNKFCFRKKISTINTISIENDEMKLYIIGLRAADDDVAIIDEIEITKYTTT